VTSVTDAPPAATARRWTASASATYSRRKAGGRPVRLRVEHHDNTVADPDLRVRDAAVLAEDAGDFLGVECLPREVDHEARLHSLLWPMRTPDEQMSHECPINETPFLIYETEC
jgi:hypothetical protein